MPKLVFIKFPIFFEETLINYANCFPNLLDRNAFTWFSVTGKVHKEL